LPRVTAFQPILRRLGCGPELSAEHQRGSRAADEEGDAIRRRRYKEERRLPELSGVGASLREGSGAPVFAGTRVPVRILFENLADGASLEEILDAYPTLRREQAVEVLREAGSYRTNRVVGVRVLIDECVPRQLKDMLSAAHDVAAAPDLGWAGLKKRCPPAECRSVIRCFHHRGPTNVLATCRRRRRHCEVSPHFRRY
jgi:uncharacterized protein (DUF433 family)